MALTYVHRLIRRVGEVGRVHRIDPASKDAEIIGLRHQLPILRRQVARPRFTWSDRAAVAILAGLGPRDYWRSFLIGPWTILGRHRSLAKRHWTYPHRRPGRPALPEETVELIFRQTRESPQWGYLRIVGEFKTLGVCVSKTTVATVVRHHGAPPALQGEGPTRTQLHSAQAAGTVDTDFLPLDKVFLRRHCVPFVIELHCRLVPAQWVAQFTGARWGPRSRLGRFLVTNDSRSGCLVPSTTERHRHVVGPLHRSADAGSDERVQRNGHRASLEPGRLGGRARGFCRP